jgi:hypothetical protein
MMRLKYKKIILITTMSTMGIGLLTLSVSHDRTLAKSESNIKAVQEIQTTDSDNNVLSTAPTITKTPSQAPLPVYKIEKDTNLNIVQLFKEFYAAKNKNDVNKIKKLLSDPSEVESKESLKKKTQYIEDYNNLKTYVKKSFKEGTYIVFVYHEIKFAGIKTPAPGLSKFYVVTGTDNKLKIFSGDMDAATQAYYDARNDDSDVEDLIKMTNDKSEKAIEKDKDLKNFWKNIDKLAKDSTKSEADKTE